MTAPMSTPSWYDVLGVAPDASAEEIRSAWRAAIGELDPTDRRFSVLNEAAGVLLDPRARAEYDAELEPEPAVPSTAPEPDRAGVVSVPGWLLAGLAVLTLALVAVTAVVWVKAPSAQSVEDATGAAQSAAERAIVPILSYDARHIDESKAAAEPYLTSDYRKKYDQLFDGVIKENAPSTGTVLKASLLRSGLVRSGEDRVQVFMLVNQARTNKQHRTPEIYKNWVTLTMEKVDGDWLVADLET